MSEVTPKRPEPKYKVMGLINERKIRRLRSSLLVYKRASDCHAETMNPGMVYSSCPDVCEQDRACISVN